MKSASILALSADWLEKFGLSSATALGVSRAGILILALIIGVTAHYLLRRLVIRLLHSLASRSKTDIDDILFQERVFSKFALIAPLMILQLGAEIALSDQTEILTYAERFILAGFLLVGMIFGNALINVAVRYLRKLQSLKGLPIKSYGQVVKLIGAGLGLLILISVLLDHSPWALLSGLGALTAVLMLVFRDSLLGFVASIQIAVNDMIRVGDWIEMPKFGADGDVVDISLTTIKVQNWDKTITTIPSYSLTSDSFKNWRGMSEGTGRRIKRSIYIDMNSVRFLSPEDISYLSKFDLLKSYLPARMAQVEEHNTKEAIDTSVIVNGRRLTNIGTYRAYLSEFLKAHPQVHQGMTLLVRQLAPTEKGLPIELYFFCRDKRWIPYEDILSDIFDHIIAVTPEFGLRLFQAPGAADLRELSSADKKTYAA